MQQAIQTDFVKVQQKGLITIPKAFRDQLGIKENTLVKITKEKGRLIIEPMNDLPYGVRSYTPEEVQEFIEYDKKLSEQLKKDGLL